MNPKIKITVDAKNRAIAAFEGMATVGAKIDVEIVGLPSGIENWGTNEDFRNDSKSVRFRVVDELGHDLVRFPNVKKTSASATDGDQWQVVPATSTTPETYKTYNGTSDAQVDFNTDKLRKAFCGVAFNDRLEFGVIIDSYVDKAEFAVGKMKIQQWATASTEDPTVLPDWRETLAKLKTDLDAVETAKTAAETAATNAATSAQSAGDSATTAGGWATSASSSANSASVSATDAGNSAASAVVAQVAAEAAQALAEEAASHYPRINTATNKWQVWNATATPPGYEDTTVNATGPKGDNGVSPHIDATTGHWFVGTTDTGVTARGPKGDDGEDGSIVSVSSTGTATDEVQYITIDGVEKKLGSGTDANAVHYTEDLNKTDSDKEQARTNIGAIGKSSSIPALSDNPTISEIKSTLSAIRGICSTT